MASIRAHGIKGRATRRDDIDYRVMLAASYPIFLGVEIAARIIGRPSNNDAPRKSIFSDARRSADSTLSYAFMGR